MPDYIDTREPGWRRTTPCEDRWPNALARIEYFEDGREIGWVREAPAPPLPTEPHTVILATFRDAVDKRTYVLTEAGGWSPVPDGMGYPPRWMPERITGFEVLAEPRAGAVKRAEESARRLTAKAVLHRVRDERMNDVLLDEDIYAIAHEFGVGD